MRWIRNLRARVHSMRGEHAPALALSDGKDIRVLASAGMHLSVLDQPDEPSVERALALAKTGHIDDSLDMVRGFHAHRRAWGVRPLMGLLATHAPDRVLALLYGTQGWEDLLSYCECATGDVAAARRRLPDLSDLQAMHLALHLGDTELARQRLAQLFSAQGLAVPGANMSGARFDVFSLSCRSDPDASLDGPMVSIILTAHNEETRLPMSVGSILAQDWRRLELIIVDDGSTDGTLGVAKSLAADDGRVRVMSLGANVGTWRAKNLALSQVRGDFITMHDADDWSHPAKLRRQIRPLMEDSTLMCTSSCFFRVDEHTGRLFTRDANSFMRWNPSSVLYRAAIIAAAGPYRDNLLGSDCEFVARIEARWGVRSHVRIRHPLTVGLQRGTSLSAKFRGQDEGLLRLRHWEAWRREHAGLGNRDRFKGLSVQWTGSDGPGEAT